MEDRGQHQEEGEDEAAGSGDEGNAEVSVDQGEPVGNKHSQGNMIEKCLIQVLNSRSNSFSTFKMLVFDISSKLFIPKNFRITKLRFNFKVSVLIN